MYRLARAELRKGARYCILQGIRHGAPRTIYRAIQEEIRKNADQFTCIYEQIKKGTGENLTGNILRIFDLFRSVIFVGIESKADDLGLQKQVDAITYPQSAIRVDYTLEELAILLDESGFRVNSITLAFAKSRFYKKYINRNWTRFAEHLRQKRVTGLTRISMMLYVGTLKKIDMLPIPFYLNRRMWRKTRPILVGCRDRLVTDYLENEGAILQRVMVTYGSDHIAGMARLLQGVGWELVTSENLER